MASVDEQASVIVGNDRVAQAIAKHDFKLADDPITLEPVPNMIRLPQDHERRVIDYHAVARDSLGRIYVLFNSIERGANTRALARFRYDNASPGEESIVFDTFLGTRDWAEGTPHSLNISRCKKSDGSFDELMAIGNNNGTLILADLEGGERWRRDLTADGPQAPTCAVAAIDADAVAVVDGYATNINYQFAKSSGQLLKTTGAQGSGDCESFTNHGVDLDPDGQLVIADRGNTRLTWWSADSLEPIVKKNRQVILDMPGLEVCNTSFLGQHAVIACLNSKLAFLAPDEDSTSGYRVEAVITMPPELIAAGIDGIHDAEFTPDGRYVVVAVWERRRTERRIPTLTVFRVIRN
jgi:hypothetical protein